MSIGILGAKEQIQIAVIAFVVVNLVFFIDVGYYNFYWIGNLSNWVAFGVYFVVLSIAQLGVLVIVRKLRINLKFIYVSI